MSWWCTPGGVIVCVCVHDGLMFPHPWDSLGGGSRGGGGGGHVTLICGYTVGWVSYSPPPPHEVNTHNQQNQSRHLICFIFLTLGNTYLGPWEEMFGLGFVGNMESTMRNRIKIQDISKIILASLLRIWPKYPGQNCTVQ